jgi:acylphosphatase
MSGQSEATNEPIRRYLFFGRVQGVGFRYTAAGLARDCGVRGYVRNRSDGTVELVAQGAQANVERLLAQLGEQFAGYIESRTAEDYAGGEAFAGFEVRR